MIKNDLNEIMLLGHAYRYIDTRKRTVGYFTEDGALYIKIFLAWNSWQGPIYKIMDRVCVVDWGTGELRRCRVVELSDCGYGSRSFIVIRTL